MVFLPLKLLRPLPKPRHPPLKLQHPQPVALRQI